MVPSIFYSQEVPVLDENHDPVMQQDYTEDGIIEVPLTTWVPGPARSMGLPGFYRMIMIMPQKGWPAGRVALQVSVAIDGDTGQTLTAFEVSAV